MSVQQFDFGHGQAKYQTDRVALHLGDSRKVVANLADESIDFIFTDPPYGSNQNDGDLNASLHAKRGKKVASIANDGPKEADALVRWLFASSYRVLKPGGAIACCCHGSGTKKSQQYARWTTYLASVLDFVGCVVWDKGPMGLGWHYRRSYEFILIAKKPGSKLSWHDTSHRIENVIRPGDYGIKRLPHSRKKHPTEKPQALAEHFIKLHTKPGDVVLDPFAGAGSTLAAALATGRKAIGCELDQRWFDAAAQRLKGVE